MTPWKEDQAEFEEDIRVCYRERGLDEGQGEVAGELTLANEPDRASGVTRSGGRTHILLDVILPSSYCRLSKLNAHLGSSIIHLPSEIPSLSLSSHIPIRSRLLLIPLRLSLRGSLWSIGGEPLLLLLLGSIDWR